MYSSTTNPRRRTRRAVAPLLAASLVLAACGGDDDDAEPVVDEPATADEATEETAEATAEETTDESTAEATEEATEESASEDATEAGGDMMAEISAMCPPDIAPDKLVFTTFPGQDEAIDPVTEAFTEATGVDIEWLGNGLGDRLTKMAAEVGSPTIDVALVPIAEVPALYANGITDPTNTEIPYYDSLIDVAKVEGGYGVSVLQFGLAYNPEYVTETPTSWTDLFDDAYAGHVTASAMPNSGGYALLSMLAYGLGGDETDLTAAIDEVALYVDNYHSFMESSTNVEEQIAGGEIWMYVDIGGVVSRAVNERGLPVEFVVPDEGGPVSMNTLVIPSGSDHVGCSEAFVSFMLSPAAQLAWAENLYYGTVNSDAVFPDDVAGSLYPVPGDTESIVALDWATISVNGADTVDYWNRTVIG